MVYEGNLAEGLPAAQGDDRMRLMRVGLSDNQVWIELDAHCALYDNVEFVTGAVLFEDNLTLSKNHYFAHSFYLGDLIGVEVSKDFDTG